MGGPSTPEPTRRIDVETSVGAGRLWFDDVPEGVTTTARLVLGHGAGGSIASRDLDLLSRRLPPAGISVVRFEQPWAVAGKVAGRPPVVDAAWSDAVGPLVDDVPTWFGGRSTGARVACRTASALGAAGVVAIAFPLSPPGRPHISRFDELAAAAVPTVVLQGERDTFGRPADFPAGDYTMVPVPNADHGMRVLKGQDQAVVLDLIVTTVLHVIRA
jgi:uncharacterized protein